MMDRLYEVSWEVCNKVGGINTVLASKAALMREQQPGYTLIGPYFERNAFELEMRAPSAQIQAAFVALLQKGIKCYYGVWQIKGEPTAILIDFSSFASQKDRLKTQLWEAFHIDSLGAEWEFEEPIVFGAAVAELLIALEAEHKGTALCHCHEWMAGSALLFLKHYQSKIKTVFTTHATMLGRAICGNGLDLYEMLDTIDPSKQAYEQGVHQKHQTETACAKNADVFTTVSEITALEAEKLLGRRPDVILPNGLDLDRFPTLVDTSIKHISSRDRLREFIIYHFFPYYQFSLDDNLIFCMTGRPEWRNKGVDLTITALARLNQLLKEKKSTKTVTFFLWMPLGNGGVRIDVLQSKNYYSHIRNYIDTNADDILRKVLYDMLSSNGPVCETLFSKEFISHIKADLRLFKRQGKPPISTHYITWGQEYIDRFAALGLDNGPDTKVKIAVVPVYLDGNDGLFNLAYYDALAGANLGLFPSYYEPWGYTPLEAAAMAVPCITTDLAGFGRFIDARRRTINPGITVLKRHQKDYEKLVEEFAQEMLRFTKLDEQDQGQNKVAARELAELCDWKKFIKNYKQAYTMAMKK